MIKQQIPDKEWLERVSIAYHTYPQPSTEVKEFISWLYKQYGIVVPHSTKGIK
jgi:hypothetical protein